VDHLDKDFGHVDHLDKDFGHIDHIDSQSQMGDSNVLDYSTPAPFMLLFSTSLLVFGITGMISSYITFESIRFLAFPITPGITFLITKLISIGWRKMAKSRFYQISSTKNLIGKEAEVILDVDERGGVIKVSSDTPLKFEKLHVKPLNPESKFDEGTRVYICDVRQGYLLVDNNKKLIRR
ncbi:MAG: NfeD family protein, partial [Promethearchaeota archaeon]